MTAQRVSVGTDMQMLLLADPAWMRRCAAAGQDIDIVLDPSSYPALLDDGEVVVFDTGEENLFTIVLTDDLTERDRYALTEPAEFLLHSTGRMLLIGEGDFARLGDGDGVGDGNYSQWVDLPTGALTISVHAVTQLDGDSPDFVVVAQPAAANFRPTQRSGMPIITPAGVEEVDAAPIDTWYPRTDTDGDEDWDRKLSGQLQLPVRLVPEVVLGPGSELTETLTDSSSDLSDHQEYRQPFIACASADAGAPGCIMVCNSQRRRSATEKDITWEIRGFGLVDRSDSATGQTAALVACPPPAPATVPVDVDSVRTQLIDWLRAHPPQPPTHRVRTEAEVLSHAAAMRTVSGLLELAFRALPLPLEVVLPMAVANDAERWQLLTDFYHRTEDK